MKEVITTIMCVSFVGGLYEIVVDCYFQKNVWYTGGGYYGTKWVKDEEISYSRCASEEQVRALISDEQWQELMLNDIIDCNINL